MAGYVGSTWGSTQANPPVLLADAIGGRVLFATTGSTVATALPTGASGAKLWLYSSTNLYSDAWAAGFFNDGPALGMQRGDVMIGVFTSADSTAPKVYFGAIGASAGSTSVSLTTAVSSTAV